MKHETLIHRSLSHSFIPSFICSFIRTLLCNAGQIWVHLYPTTSPEQDVDQLNPNPEPAEDDNEVRGGIPMIKREVGDVYERYR